MVASKQCLCAVKILVSWVKKRYVSPFSDYGVLRDRDQQPYGMGVNFPSISWPTEKSVYMLLIIETRIVMFTCVNQFQGFGWFLLAIYISTCPVEGDISVNKLHFRI